MKKTKWVSSPRHVTMFGTLFRRHVPVPFIFQGTSVMGAVQVDCAKTAVAESSPMCHSSRPFVARSMALQQQQFVGRMALMEAAPVEATSATRAAQREAEAVRAEAKVATRTRTRVRPRHGVDIKARRREVVCLASRVFWELRDGQHDADGRRKQGPLFSPRQ